MGKMTIFVPDEVLAEMQAVRNKSGPNWSQIATTAFRETLQQISKARANMASAVLLPFPTTGDYSLFEVRHGRKRFRVKVVGTLCTPNYYLYDRLPLIVGAFAAEILEERPDISDGSVLDKMLTTTDAKALDARLGESE